MAIYGDLQFLYKRAGRADEFATLHDPGAKVPFSGIYKCEVCGFELVAEKLRPLPSEDNWHRHNQNQGPIKWRLIVHAFHGQILGP
jgi:hypothetical protein